MTFCVSITTHNRIDDLRRTLERLETLHPAADEVIISCDNCTDGTQAFVRQHYPQHELLENPVPLGSIGSRDRINRAASADIILSLDDDSYPVEADFFARLAELFTQFPELGLVTFPQRTDEYPETLEQTDFGPSTYVGSYPNSGAAFRRNLYQQVPGYPVFFFHAYEEPDFALQLWHAGYTVVRYTGLTIRHHYTTVQRNENRTHQRHARNEALAVILRAPALMTLPLLVYRGLSQARYALSRGVGWVVREPQWWWAFLMALPRAMRERDAMPRRSYIRWLRLLGNPLTAPEFDDKQSNNL